ncbi:MAG: dTDP-4-dehydrorhamnose 3,5-epimerase family protein, partial [Clostridium sp.]|nr:dTDP-4-dehydrorhamnose 3,5-epimerase family protein [Clostridium sp.]
LYKSVYAQEENQHKYAAKKRVLFISSYSYAWETVPEQIAGIKGVLNEDVVIDLRRDSKTFGKFTKVNLNEENKNLIYVPSGCAHGYYISGNKEALIYYKVTKPFIRSLRGGVHWNSLNIPWSFDYNKVLVENEDTTWPRFEDFTSPF